MSTGESIQSEKTLAEIFEEVKGLRNEIIYYIENYLPQLQYKTFIFGEERINHFMVRRQFRLMCLLFAKKLKKYNLDARIKVLIFLDPKCLKCHKTEELELHHSYKDGKDDRGNFDEYEIFMWQYYLIHLDEAYDRLRVMCQSCHDDTHNSTSLFDKIFEEFFH